MIRQATINDLDSIVELYIDANPNIRESDIHKWTKSGLTKYPELNWIYEVNKAVVGSISGVRDQEGNGVINDIAVKKDQRGKGVGSKLIEELAEQFKKNGIIYVQLFVFWQNAPVIPFYYKHGFKVSKTGKEMNQDVIYLVRNLE